MNIGDLAQLTSLSKVTVSRALNNHDNVRPETKARILRALDEEGYVYDRERKRLRRNRTARRGPAATRRVTLLVGPTPGTEQDDPMDTPWSRYTNALLTEGITTAAHREHGELILQPALHHENATPSQAKQALSRRKLDGVIVISGQSPAFHDEIRRQGLACSLIFPPDDLVPSPILVDLDAHTGLTEAFAHLVGMGHRRIAVFSSEATEKCKRLETCIGILTRLGAEMREVYFRGLHGDYGEPSSGFELMARVMALPDPPTAVFTGNDVMALGALRYCRRHGLDVPGDVSLVGFDDRRDVGEAGDFLTTIRWDPVRVGEVAFTELFAAISQRHYQPRTALVPTGFIVRSSVDRPRR